MLLEKRLTLQTECHIGQRFEATWIDIFAAALAHTILASVKALNSGSDLRLQRTVVVEHRLVALILCQRAGFVVLLAGDAGAIQPFAWADRLLPSRAGVDVALNLLQIMRQPLPHRRLVILRHAHPSSHRQRPVTVLTRDRNRTTLGYRYCRTLWPGALNCVGFPPLPVTRRFLAQLNPCDTTDADVRRVECNDIFFRREHEHMLAKLATLVQSKTALAVLGVVLVGGGSGAVAVAATTGHLSTLGVNLNVASGTKTAESTETPDSHAHTTSVEGLLTACTANTISVQDGTKTWTFVVSSTTKYNGDINTNGAGASSAKGDNSANAGGASTGGASTAHVAASLSDVCATANINARDVQVQATANGTEYDAWKVTLQGPGSAKSGSEGGDTSSSDSKGSSTDKGSSSDGQNAPELKSYEGTVTAVSATGFTLTHNGMSAQVVVSATTHFSGVSSLSAITVNSHVSVTGTLSGTTLTATSVEVSAPDSTATSGN